MSRVIFDPASQSFRDDPYPTYKLLRQEAPAYFHEESGLWILTRYSDIERATSDYGTFSSARGNALIDSPLRVGKTLGSMDPPRHDELRRVIQRAFSPARIESLLPHIRRDVAERVSDFSISRRCDFVNDISRPVLFDRLGQLLGLDEASAKRATELSAGLFHNEEFGPMGPALGGDNFVGIIQLLGELLAAREAGPGDDLITVLLEAQKAGAPLNNEEIVANMSTVLLAGNASIGHFSPNLVHALWLHPEQRSRVLADPSLISAAIEEAVRWDTSTQSFARQVVQDVDIDGTVIPAGSRVVLLYGSANRDELAIERADEFDITRRRVRHFGFGMGPHVCAGAIVARAMLKTMLEALFPLVGEYELDTSRASRVHHIMVRGFKSLPMSW